MWRSLSDSGEMGKAMAFSQNDLPRQELLEAARKAARFAYPPYSNFRVGAAVLVDGHTYSGCNIENASYGLTICAERAAIFGAVSAGGRRLQALAVTCPDAPPDSPPEHRMPCGACRQVMAEFAPPDLPVYVDGVGDFRLSDLFPLPFTLRVKTPEPAEGARRLCVDIDNVIADTDVVMRQVIRDYTGGRVNLAYEQITDFDYYKCQDSNSSCISREEWGEIHRLFSEDRFLLQIKPVEGAAEALTRLGQKFTIHLATSRLPAARKATIVWLEEHQFPPHDIHFLKHREKHVSLGRFFAAVEDHYEQAADFGAAGTPCYLIRHPWNRNKPSRTNVSWVDGWPELTATLLDASR